jgi:hypothetical protein
MPPVSWTRDLSAMAEDRMGDSPGSRHLGAGVHSRARSGYDQRRGKGVANGKTCHRVQWLMAKALAGGSDALSVGKVRTHASFDLATRNLCT